MFTRYAIKVTETIIYRQTGEKVVCEPRYLDRYLGNGMITTDHHVAKTFDTAEQATETIDELPVGRCGSAYNKKYAYEVETVEYGYANMHGWSDVAPFEIIRVISPKTIELRAMSAELDDEFKPEFVSGGFAGHCTNQGKQTYKYKSCPEGVVVRARLGKKGWKSSHGRHVLSTEPRKFYDYNF